MKYTLALILSMIFLQACNGPVSIKPMSESRSTHETLYDQDTGRPVAYFTISQEYNGYDYYENTTRLTVRNISNMTVTFNFTMYVSGPGYNRTFTDSVVYLPVGSTYNFGIISYDNFNLNSCQVSIVSPDEIDYTIPFSNG